MVIQSKNPAKVKHFVTAKVSFPVDDEMVARFVDAGV
jgi:hypothetical protein